MLEIHTAKEPEHYIFNIMNKSVVEMIVIYDVFGKRPAAYIHKVYTAEEEQNKGYASRLLGMAIDVAKQLNCYKVFVICNEDNKAFYQKNGFKADQISMRINLER